MFERLSERAARLGAARSRARTEEFARRLGEELPRGIDAASDEEGVRLSGRGMIRRLALDARLRWLLAGLR
jgi:hypothetical protein